MADTGIDYDWFDHGPGTEAWKLHSAKESAAGIRALVDQVGRLEVENKRLLHKVEARYTLARDIDIQAKTREILVKAAFEAAEISHGRAAELLGIPKLDLREKGWVQGRWDEQIAGLEKENKRLKDELAGANECLQMVKARIELLGEPMTNTPPMMYDDAISALVFRRLKEAGEQYCIDWLVEEGYRVVPPEAQRKAAAFWQNEINLCLGSYAPRPPSQAPDPKET